MSRQCIVKDKSECEYSLVLNSVLSQRRLTKISKSSNGKMEKNSNFYEPIKDKDNVSSTHYRFIYFLQKMTLLAEEYFLYCFITVSGHSYDTLKIILSCHEVEKKYQRT